jgi:peptidoglycan/LPS O-acetylase OafA/YrhL
MNRLTRLDGLRGVLAVYVMLGHALPFTALPSWISAPFAHGEAAVDLFFALSGLVISNSLERFNYECSPFIRARARRLLPVYFTVLAFALAVLCLGSPLPLLPWIWANQAALNILGTGLPPLWGWHLAAHILLLQGLIPQGALPFAYVTILGPAWSLSTEWQFYFVIALIKRRLPVFTLGLLLTGVAYHLATPHLPPDWQFSRAFLGDAAPYFALGLASAMILRGNGAGVFVITFITTICLGVISPEPSRALIPLAWGTILLIQVKGGFPGRMLDSNIAQFLGAISYPLYLINEPTQRALMLFSGRLADGDATTFTYLWLPLAVTLPILAATCLHRYVERLFDTPSLRAREAGAAIHLLLYQTAKRWIASSLNSSQ